MKRPINIKIIRQSELRMGSPYMMCELEITGTNLDLPTHDWQDKFAWSDNNKILTLIHWELEKNNPGFRFYIIDTETNTLKITERISGLVNNIDIKDGKVLYNKFLFDRDKSKPGELCCYSDEEYEIKK